MKPVTKYKLVGVWKENVSPTMNGELAVAVRTSILRSPIVWATSVLKMECSSQIQRWKTL